MDLTQVNPIQSILLNRRAERVKGLYSCCSANEYVLRAVMRRSIRCSMPALIESTANQVNQFGGYTGMKPEDFIAFVERIAHEEGLPSASLLIGGDHLGPLTWAGLPADTAMENARRLVSDCVLAGYIKIHLDTSMRLGGDDPYGRLPDGIIAQRGASLCAAAERAFAEYRRKCPTAAEPVYVIGSEVPVPGGALQNESEVAVTSADDCKNTLDEFHAAFEKADLHHAWKRVVAIVVQPGVEFADESVVEYHREPAQQLVGMLDSVDNLVFEGHSTDYQPAERLREMVEDGICILKVGPALTFGLREGLFALECIERELTPLYGFQLSGLRKNIDRAMLEKPAQWERYYHGTEEQMALARAFSYSDRVRYYLPETDVQASIRRLMQNLDSIPIPMTLISQYLPMQFRAVQSGAVENRPEDLLIDHIGNWIDDYLYATTGGITA